MEIVNVEDPGLKVHIHSKMPRTSHASTSTYEMALSIDIDSQPSK